VTLLDERHNDEHPEVSPTLPSGVEPKFEECLPNKVTEMAPEVAELVTVVDDNVGVVNDDACENITLRARPVVTIAIAKTPFPADTRHLMDDSDNHTGQQQQHWAAGLVVFPCKETSPFSNITFEHISSYIFPN